MTTSVVVVGAGLAGAATAWRLAERGHDVTVLERGVPADPRGSSHGSARIFRYAYPDPFWARLVVAARREWDELESRSRTRLITPTGALDHGDRRDPEQLAGVLREAGVEHELLTPPQARERWPQFRFEGDVLWHPGAGVLDAATAVGAMLALAEQAGAKVLTGRPVTALKQAGTGYRVQGEDVDLAADQVVLAAGGWLPDLLDQLPTGLRRTLPEFTVTREQTFHFPFRDATEPWPSFIHKSAALQTYGLPGGRDAGHAGLKVAEYAGGRAIASAREDDGVIDPANRAKLTTYVRTHLPGLVPEPDAGSTCLFTTTPTEDFVVTGADGLLVLSPCSGHGAKFAPLIGTLTADALTGRPGVPARFRGWS